MLFPITDKKTTPNNSSLKKLQPRKVSGQNLPAYQKLTHIPPLLTQQTFGTVIMYSENFILTILFKNAKLSITNKQTNKQKTKQNKTKTCFSKILGQLEKSKQRSFCVGLM